MKKEVILFLIVILGVCLICGCVNQSQTSTQKTVLTPSPTLQNQFKAMEPASDGNLKITVLGTGDGDRIYGNEKHFLIKIRLENLRSDKKIQVMGSDFQLISSNYNIPQTFLAYDLGPGQWGEPTLDYGIPQDAKNLKLKFDFSGPSGQGKGGKIVYFIL